MYTNRYSTFATWQYIMGLHLYDIICRDQKSHLTIPPCDAEFAGLEIAGQELGKDRLSGMEFAGLDFD